jgi:sugar-phosphatase
MTGARELVASIPANRWAVVTSGTRLLATARLKLARIPMPGVLVTAEDVVSGKPDPEPYRTGAERLGLTPSECVVIEDAPAGIASGRAAGARVIALAGTYPPAELGSANAIVQSLAGIRVRVDGRLHVAF